ncbi:MAG TPA: hypothetical protein VJ385_21045 [Fibrobacteria bacterium]|nr:hypothetical protein [Fibrobacteria bacterium]
MPKSARPITGPIRAAALLLACVLTALSLYLALQVFPQPLFHYHETWSNIGLYSDRPIPSAARAYVDSARALLARSPWNDTILEHRIFICQSRWRFALLTGTAYKVGGQNSVYLARNIFIRPVNWASGRLISHSGREVPGDRTLPYYFAHEITHGLTMKHLGRLAYYRLPSWKREGYADYIGRPRFDFPAMLDAFRNGDPNMDPLASGFYWRYQLMTQYLLEVRKLPPDAIFQNQFPVPALEAELRSLPL